MSPGYNKVLYRILKYYQTSYLSEVMVGQHTREGDETNHDNPK